MTRKRTLDDILADDDLIEVPKPSVKASPEDARIRQDFEEICRFVDEHGRMPGQPDGDGSGRRPSTTERSLAIRLKAYRANRALKEKLAPFDRHRLLEERPAEDEGALPPPKSIDDILARDDGILSDDADDIFNLRFVEKGKELFDFAAERVPCADFHLYKPLFDAVAADIQSGRRTTRRFANEQDIEKGDFFILNGVLVYVADVRDDHIRYGRRDARLTCVFDNGTESDMLLRSLARALYGDKNGRRVSNPEAGPLFGQAVTEKDVRRGCVYVAASLSKNPQISAMRNLYKVGVTNGSPEMRIKRAEFDPTFLMAPARLLKTYTIYNADPVQVEAKLHAFFAEVSLGIEVPDRFGRKVKPREWFVLPLEAIDFAIQRMFDGTLSQYRYDRVAQTVVRA